MNSLKSNSKTKMLAKLVLTSVISLTTMSALTTAASAMIVQNCDTNGGVGVKVTGQSSGTIIQFRLEPGQKKSFQTSRGEKWRLNLNPIGKDVQYSGFAGNAVVSLVRIAGNLEVTRGLKCEPKPKPKPEPKPEPDPDRGGGYDWPENHILICLRKYRSYDPSTNTWVGFDGQVNLCSTRYYRP